MIYLQLFLSFFQIGILSFGGGYAAMPLIQEQVINVHHWLTLSAFSDLVAIAEMTPGPIAVNAATFVGTQIAGVPGAVVATFGCILPSCIIVSVLTWFYTRYHSLSAMQGALGALRPAVVAMIAKAGLTILGGIFFVEGTAFCVNGTTIRMMVYFIGALILLRKTRISPILIMLGCGLCEAGAKMAAAAAGFSGK